MPKPTITQAVGAWELRRRFKEAQLEQRVTKGEVTVTVKRSGHPSPPPACEPVCTRSETLEYRDNSGVKLSVAHRYLRPDGTIGASGKPDPKLLRVGPVLYVLVPELDRP